MPKKSRKGRMTYKVRPSPKVSAVKEASQAQPLPVSSRQAVITKSSTTIGGQAGRLHNVASRTETYPFHRWSFVSTACCSFPSPELNRLLGRYELVQGKNWEVTRLQCLNN